MEAFSNRNVLYVNNKKNEAISLSFVAPVVYEHRPSSRTYLCFTFNLCTSIYMHMHISNAPIELLYKDIYDH